MRWAPMPVHHAYESMFTGKNSNERALSLDLTKAVEGTKALSFKLQGLAAEISANEQIERTMKFSANDIDEHVQM